MLNHVLLYWEYSLWTLMAARSWSLNDPRLRMVWMKMTWSAHVMSVVRMKTYRSIMVHPQIWILYLQHNYPIIHARYITLLQCCILESTAIGHTLDNTHSYRHVLLLIYRITYIIHAALHQHREFSHNPRFSSRIEITSATTCLKDFIYVADTCTDWKNSTHGKLPIM